MSDFNIFGDLDLASAADDPFAVEDGTYDAVVVESVVKSEKKNPNRKGLALKYQIEGGPMNGRKVSDWRNIPLDKADENYDTDRSFMKGRLTAFGVPEDRFATFQPQDAMGARITITVKNREVDGTNYTNVTKVVARNDSAAGSSDTSNNAFAGL